jgi:hypothetical protein
MKFNIVITSSKILAYFIFLVGSIYGFIDLIWIKSGNGAMVLTTSMASAGTVISVKNGSDAFKNKE